MSRLRGGSGLLVIGLMLILIMTALTLSSYRFLPHDPTAMAVRQRLAPPSRTHLLGTDHYGRDILSRIMVASRISLLVGIVSVAAGLSLGVFLGAWSGYRGGIWDELLMRLADSLYAFPALLMALLAVTLWGPGEKTVMLAIAFANIPIFMRLTRSGILSLRENAYVEAAVAVGCSPLRVIIRHMLPNMLPTLLVQASASFAAAVLAEASLSYLGVGAQPPLASWGRMLREAQSYAPLAPWYVLFPGLAIAITVLGFNLLGDGIQALSRKEQ